MNKKNIEFTEDGRLIKRGRKSLKQFLDDVRILKVRNIIVSQFDNTVAFHISGKPGNNKKVEAEYCSPNCIADICLNHFEIPLNTAEIVKISNWVK